jgi:hypothetical protein
VLRDAPGPVVINPELPVRTASDRVPEVSLSVAAGAVVAVV